MDFEQYKRDFAREASKFGYTEQNVILCLNYAEKLISNGVPVIYNTTHLSALVGYKKNYLKKASLFPSSFYRNFEIFKSNGKKRTISEPLPSLKEIQDWILRNILDQVGVSRYAKAYVPGTSIKQNLIYHRGQQQVLAVDIENFFPSIKQDSVQEIFASLGYSGLISNLLAKLCCLDKALPQGAPTSPYLSNLYLKSLDDFVFDYCRGRKIRYTRYADDMTFSGNFESKELLQFLSGELTKLNLKINKAKTKLMTQNMRQTVTGIVVNDKLQVSFNKRNKLRQEIYYIQKFGLEDHMRRMDIKKANYIEHLLGRVNFILYLNSDDREFKGYKEFLYSLK